MPSARLSDSTPAVFLSYASQDAEAARRICAALQAAGIEVWLDESELRGGDVWDQTIRRQIKACALFIPMISASTCTRVEGYFRLEWKLAVDRSHLIAAERAFLLPVVIDATREDEALVPDKFREVQWTRSPAGDVPASFVERVRRLLSPQETVASRADLQAPAANSAAVPRRPGRGRRLLLGAAAAVAMLTVAVVVMMYVGARTTAIGLVAVLPFENATGDPAIEYLSDGISESLINKLSSLSGIKVISRTSAFAFKGRKLQPTEIGRQLGVDALILGSLAQRGASLAITAELVRVRDATQLWGEKYARRADDVLEVEGEIATTIARTLHRRLSGEEQARLTLAETSDPEAYRLYLKGRDYLVGNQQEMDKSVDYFQQAVARAPNYAMAHSGLAEAYTIQAFLRAAGRSDTVGKARAAVTRALELDPHLAEAHTALGLVRFYFDWDWAGADAELRRAIELNPGSREAHEEYGAYLTAMGRLDEGRAQSLEAVRLDPLSVSPVHDVAFNALVRGEYHEAAAGFRRTIEIDPNWTWGYIKLARTLAMQGQCKAAFVQTEIAEGRIAGGAAPLSRSWLGTTYAICGDPVRARRKVDELHALEKAQYVDPVTFASVQGALGEVDAAVRGYEQAMADRTPNMVFAAMQPRLSRELIGNARYQAIVQRMGFPSSAR